MNTFLLQITLRAFSEQARAPTEARGPRQGSSIPGSSSTTKIVTQISATHEYLPDTCCTHARKLELSCRPSKTHPAGTSPSALSRGLANHFPSRIMGVDSPLRRSEPRSRSRKARSPPSTSIEPLVREDPV
jgi:hypothetical protein